VLELVQAFAPLIGLLPPRVPGIYPVIHGLTREAEAVTVINAWRSGWGLHVQSGGVRNPETVRSGLVFVGAWLEQDCLFAEMTFRVPGLPLWWSEPVIRCTIPGSAETGSEWSCRVQRPAKQTTAIASSGVSFDWGFSFHVESDFFTSATVNAWGLVTLRGSEPRPAEWYLHEFEKVSMMLAFLAGSPMSADYIETPTARPHQTASVIVAVRDTGYCPYKGPSEFFVLRSNMGVDLSRAIGRWLEVYPRVEAPSQLALSILGSNTLWDHVEFLSLMQALEGFHRSVVGGEYLSKEAYEPTREALSAAIPVGLEASHRKSLLSRLQWGYQYSLRRRLADLQERLSAPIRQIVLGGDGAIPPSWVDTRNFFTHWVEQERSKALQGAELYHANLRMRHFLRALYLDLIGIPQHSILESLNGPNRVAQELAWLNGGQFGRIDEVQLSPK